MKGRFQKFLINIYSQSLIDSMICFAVKLSPCGIFKMSARTFRKRKKCPDFTSLHRKIVYESSKRILLSHFFVKNFQNSKYLVYYIQFHRANQLSRYNDKLIVIKIAPKPLKYDTLPISEKKILIYKQTVSAC